MKISYIILAHNNPTQLRKLVERLNNDDCIFIIHIDKKSDIAPFKVAILNPNVHFISDVDRVACIWGDYSLVEATINCLKQSVLRNREGKTVLLSGADYPLHPSKLISDHFAKNCNVEFININPIENAWPTSYFYRTNSFKVNLSDKKNDFICVPSLKTLRPRAIARSLFKLIIKSIELKDVKLLKNFFYIFKHNKTYRSIKFYGGHQWWALNNSTIEQMLFYIESNKWFCDFFKNTLIPDEVFFHTLIKEVERRNNPFEIKNCLTFTKWLSPTQPSPEVLTEKNYDEIIAQKKRFLFARKFDMGVDCKIFELLENEK